jgi:uncharacterized protein (TIGR01777 family)
MRIAITGARGLIGSVLATFLEARGETVVRLARADPHGAPADTRTPQWSVTDGLLDPERLGEIDAVVHLAGESVGGARWSPAVKARIRDSRVGPTAALARSLAQLPRRPRVLITASAIGYYGDRGAEPLTERSGPGEGFLAEVCQAWEAAAAPAADEGIRVVSTRFGIVLDGRGGALAQMRLPFSLGLGGPVGSGRQYYSWVAMADLLGAVATAIDCDDLRGPVNVTSPEPVPNAEFTRALGRVLHRPAVMPIPAFALRLLFGEIADAELLSSKRVLPEALLAAGYSFVLPRLEDALRAALATR